MVFATFHSSGSHHTSVDVHSTSERLWPLPGHLQCSLEYPRVWSWDLSFLYSTLQMYCSLWRTTDAWGIRVCLMHTRMTRRFLGYVAPLRQMSCNTVYLTAWTLCHRWWQLIVYSWTRRRQKRSGVHLLAVSTRFRPHLFESAAHDTAARNLGIYLDGDVSMRTHVTTTDRACFAMVHQIRSIRHSLPRPAMLTMLRSLVINKLDSCSSVMAGAPDVLLHRLQSVLKGHSGAD